MRRLLISIILLIVVSFSFFALDSQTGYVYINGYFEETEASVVFKIWKENLSTDLDRIYHAGEIYLDGDPTSDEETIFNWELYGNRELTVHLVFTITPLQAFSNGTYYIPKHTVKMYDGVLTQTHTFATASTGSSSYPGYRQSNSGAGSFIINSAVFSYDENINDVTSKTGYCTLEILEYDEDTAGNFDYVSYVTVEFSTI